MKTCPSCQEDKATTAFYVSRKEKDGLQRSCKTCLLRMQKEKRERVKAGDHVVRPRLVHPEGKKVCVVCGEAKDATIENFIPYDRGRKGLKGECRVCTYRGVRKRREKSWASRLREYTYGRHSQRWKSEKYNLTPEMIMELYEQQSGRCAWFGVSMTTGMGAASQVHDPHLVTLDRIDCGRGYTSDNVVLVCKAANQARGNTPSHEFAKFVEEIKRN